MSVYPILWEPLAPTGAYRHLQRRDVATWERFLEKHASEWDQVAYDVAVGGQLPVGEQLTEEDRLGWRYTTALKIDVLLANSDAVVVVEVKPAASVSAIGAALTYPLLLARENPELGFLESGIVCNHLPPDIADVAEHFSLRTWVV